MEDEAMLREAIMNMARGIVTRYMRRLPEDLIASFRRHGRMPPESLQQLLNGGLREEIERIWTSDKDSLDKMINALNAYANEARGGRSRRRKSRKSRRRKSRR
jgi:hypothetical protein